MQLIYRGVAYNYQSNHVQLPISSQVGKYRGQTFDLRSSVRVLRLSSVVLKYRGIEYLPQSNYAVSRPWQNGFFRKSVAISIH